MTKLIKTILLISAVIFCASGASATQINDVSNGEPHLFAIVNQMIGTGYGSSMAIPQVDDAEDNYWQKTSSSGLIWISVRYAGFLQGLGIITIDQPDDFNNITPIVNTIYQGYHDIFPLVYQITESKVFAFAEMLPTVIGDSAPLTRAWYSDDRNSPGFDHFVAFDVTDEFNNNGENPLSGNVNSAYVLAWEDTAPPPAGSGDSDYNDLVILVVEVQPTAITLASFDAKPGNGKVTLNWVTGDEKDNLGFNIYRADSKDGVYVKINDSLISSKAGSGLGTTYEFTDSGAQNRQTYSYKLEDVDIYGLKTQHGPVSATPRLFYGLFQ